MSASWFDVVSGNATGATAAAARAGLRLLSCSFAAAAATRRWLYAHGVLKTGRAPVPVISVGNISVGGTGKTPLVEYLARGLAERGRKPAVVSRGYRARRGQSGDEARMLRANLGESAVVVEDANRLRGSVRAVSEFAADVVVLDDGFQHLALEREIDIVALDATNPFGFGRLLPAGCLREGPEQLRRADVVVITRANLVPPDDLSDLRDRLRALAPELLVLEATYAPVSIDFAHGTSRDAGAIRGKAIAAFCGIGNPYAFGLTLRQLGTEVVLAKRFADHHAFTAGELAPVFDEARRRGAALVVTTQKDLARIAPETIRTLTGPPLCVLRAAFAVRSGEDDLWRLIVSVVGPGRAIKP